jgi:tRNA(Arg) A34 adenosine deaminase TadA
MRSLLLVLTLGVALVFAHEACQTITQSTFNSGSQHCDCDYTVPPGDGTSDAAQHEIDLTWLRMVHNYSVTNMARYPFGAALVDNRTNTLVQIGFNNYFTADPIWSSAAVSHAETVVMTNATLLNFPGTYNATNGNRGVAPDWKYMILYGNIEACPMCAQAAMWRGIKKMVFGARASVLQSERCWTQPGLTAKEVWDQNAYTTYDFIRGPFDELELDIVNDFKQQCKSSTTAPTSAPSSGARNAENAFSNLVENIRALV